MRHRDDAGHDPQKWFNARLAIPCTHDHQTRPASLALDRVREQLMTYDRGPLPIGPQRNSISATVTTEMNDRRPLLIEMADELVGIATQVWHDAQPRLPLRSVHDCQLDRIPLTFEL